MKFVRIFFLLLSISVLAYAQGTPFILTGIKKVYPVVEIHSDYVPSIYKDIIMQKITDKLKSLKIDTTGYSPRSFAMIVSQVAVGEDPVIKIMFVIGEEVKREDDGEEVFALTYMNNDIFDLNKADEDIPESVDFLLDQFEEQYKEDNQ